jgi:DNA-binding transcriptional ArsR family regulator
MRITEAPGWRAAQSICVDAVAEPAAVSASLCHMRIRAYTGRAVNEPPAGRVQLRRERSGTETRRATNARTRRHVVEPELELLFERVSGYFALLSEPTRLKILNAMCEGERSVSDIVARSGASQTNVSRNLNLMYDRGVLKRRREGALTYYAIADETVVSLCRTVCVQVASQADEHTVTSRTLRRFMANN